MVSQSFDRRRFLKCVPAAGIGVCAGAVGWANGARAAITVRVAQSLPEASHIVRTTKHWAELVGKKTNGALDVRVFAGGSLISLTEALEALSLDSVQLSDMANTYATAKRRMLHLSMFPARFRRRGSSRPTPPSGRR